MEQKAAGDRSLHPSFFPFLSELSLKGIGAGETGSHPGGKDLRNGTGSDTGSIKILRGIIESGWEDTHSEKHYTTRIKSNSDLFVILGKWAPRVTLGWGVRVAERVSWCEGTAACDIWQRSGFSVEVKPPQKPGHSHKDQQQSPVEIHRFINRYSKRLMARCCGNRDVEVTGWRCEGSYHECGAFWAGELFMYSWSWMSNQQGEQYWVSLFFWDCPIVIFNLGSNLYQRKHGIILFELSSVNIQLSVNFVSTEPEMIQSWHKVKSKLVI